MSQPNSADQEHQVSQKQQLNVYTVMLIVAFCAITTACLLLYLELRRWGSFPWWNAETGASAAASTIYQADGLGFPQPQLKPGSPPTWS